MKVEFSRQIFEKYSNIEFHENPSSVCRVVLCGRTDVYDEANSHFSQVCERAKNESQKCTIIIYSSFHPHPMKWNIWRKMILIHTLQKVLFPWRKRGKYIVVSRVFIFIQSEMLSHDNWTLLLQGQQHYGAKPLQQWRPWGYVHSCVKRQFRPHYGPGVDSAYNINKYQKYFLRVKTAGA